MKRAKELQVGDEIIAVQTDSLNCNGCYYSFHFAKYNIVNRREETDSLGKKWAYLEMEHQEDSSFKRTLPVPEWLLDEVGYLFADGIHAVFCFGEEGVKKLIADTKYKFDNDFYDLMKKVQGIEVNRCGIGQPRPLEYHEKEDKFVITKESDGKILYETSTMTGICFADYFGNQTLLYPTKEDAQEEIDRIEKINKGFMNGAIIKEYHKDIIIK